MIQQRRCSRRAQQHLTAAVCVEDGADHAIEHGLYSFTKLVAAVDRQELVVLDSLTARPLGRQG